MFFRHVIFCCPDAPESERKLCITAEKSESKECFAMKEEHSEMTTVEKSKVSRSSNLRNRCKTADIRGNESPGRLARLAGPEAWLVGPEPWLASSEA